MCDRRSPHHRAVLLCALSIALAVSTASAQQPPPAPPGPLTLDQVLELAIARSESIAVARAGVRRAEGQRLRAQSGRLPQLTASASYDRALASEFENVFGPSTSGPVCPPFALNPQASLDARVSEIERAIDCGGIGANPFGGATGDSGDGDLSDLPFGRKNTWRATLNFSQNIYSGGRLGAQADIAAAGKQTADLTLTSSRAQVVFDVTQAYFDALLSDRLVSIADATLQQADATLRQTQAGFDAGTQPEFEVLRARVNRDNQTPILIRQRVNRAVAILRLKQMLDLPPDYDLRLADSLGGDNAAPPPVFAERIADVERTLTAPVTAAPVAAIANVSPTAVTDALTGVALPDRTAVGEAEATVRLREASLRAVQAERRPSVTFNSSYGRVSYPSGVVPAIDSFRTNWTLGASMQVPILTGGRQRGDELAARADLDESRARLQQTQELAALDTRSAWAELIAARAAWEASAGTVEQANRAYEIADVRFRAGVSTQLELSDSRVLLQQAEANRAQAARDLQVARARVALLPDLPLGSVGAGGQQRQTAPAPQTPSAPQAPTQVPGGGTLRNAAATGGSQLGTR